VRFAGELEPRQPAARAAPITINSSRLVIGTDAIIDETMLSVNGSASVTHCWTVAKMPAARPTVAPAAVDGLGSKKSSAKPPMYGFMLLDAGRGKDALVAFETISAASATADNLREACRP